MSTIRTETVPQTWNDETDPAFFTVTARLFSAAFTLGASVLLASFDPRVDGSAGTSTSGPAIPAADSAEVHADAVPTTARCAR